MSRIAPLELLHHKIFVSSILYHIAPKLPGSVAVVLVGDRVVVSPRINISYKCSVPYIFHTNILLSLTPNGIKILYLVRIGILPRFPPPYMQGQILEVFHNYRHYTNLSRWNHLPTQILVYNFHLQVSNKVRPLQNKFNMKILG